MVSLFPTGAGRFFEDMQAGGITAANCTCSVWEGFKDTMLNVARWKQWFDEHDDLLLQVHTTEDIRRAKTQGKVGIILGWQNTWGIEDQLGLPASFQGSGSASNAIDVQHPEPGRQRLLGEP